MRSIHFSHPGRRTRGWIAVLLLATSGAALGSAGAAGGTAPADGKALVEAGLAALQARLDAGDPGGALRDGRRLLRSLPEDDTVTAAERAQVYALMFEGARRDRDSRGGSLLAADLQKEDRRRYGAGSAERVPGLYEVARWYAWADRPQSERGALTTALALLESTHGPRDARLAYPLRAIAASCVRSRSDEDLARASLERALQLDFPDTREGVLSRAEVFATRGDVEAIFVAPASGTSWYRTAWQRLADSKLAGPEAARAAFAQPTPIYVHVPDAPFRSRKGDIDHFAAGTVSFAFTVSALGTIEQLRLRQSVAPIDSLPEPVTEAFRDARYRPRLVAGEPVATPDHGFELRFSRDATRASRRINVGPVDQQR